MSRFHLKLMAKQQIRGNIGMLFVCSLIVIAITGAAAAIPAVGLVASLLLSAPLEIGLITIFLKLRDGQPPQIEELFNHFDILGQEILLYLLTSLFITLWSFLFVIPSIIAALSYSMAPYILAENKNLTAMEAIKMSKQMMNGHKTDLFVLYLSFIGWGLLISVTFGLASIYVAPYIQATMVNFYDSIKGYKTINAEVYDA